MPAEDATTPAFTFRHLLDDDLELMHTWLNEPGVVRWWEGDDVTPDGVWSTYSPNRPAALEGTDSTENWLALIDDEPVGWICCWPVLEGLEESKPWFPLGVEETAAGIDYLIGAPLERGKGLGSGMIRAFALDVVFGRHPWFTQAAAGPYTANVASCRALEKAGFTFRGSVTHPGEAHDPCSLMVMDRPATNPDACFSDPRWAAMYDELDPDRSDLDHYLAIVDELGAESVLDVGCGTGVFAHMLADRGVRVVGLDPAAASLDVAKGKPGSERVRWVHGDASTLADTDPDLRVDLAVMTGNVAQVFLTDEAWASTLAAVHSVMAPGGHLVFETRIPSRRAWEEWTRDASATVVEVDGIGRVERWVDVTDVDLPFVSFDAVVVLPSGESITSTSTLRFRERSEVEASLDEAGYAVVDVREAPDRPGKEFVFIARRRTD